MAIDITLCDAQGREIDMGPSPFYKGSISLGLMFIFTKSGKVVTKKQQANRDHLKKVMVEAGFIPLWFEWWHFDGLPHDFVRKNLPQIP